MTLVEQIGVISPTRGCDGDGCAAQVEEHLVSLGPLFIVPEALKQGCRAANGQSLWKAQFYDYKQNEDEQYRQRAGDSGQCNLQLGAQNREDQITEEAD